MGTALLTVAGVALAAVILLAGVIVFVLGLFKRRPKVWAAGLALSMASVVGTTGVVIWAGGKAWMRVTRWLEPANPAPRDWLEAATGLPWPAEAHVVETRTTLHAIPPLATHEATIKVPASFEELLVRKLEKEPGTGATRTFKGARSGDDGAVWAVEVRYDPALQTAYVLAAEAWN